MNIQEAKEQIKNAMTAYFTKDDLGNYIVPIEKQRPVFLMGPPGVGKTAIMEQVAQELGVGLLSYSMTHHTRQSALGLPSIEEKTFNGKTYKVSEYTMSEIISAVYELMEKTGVKEGILFLDEINCVSETLAPIMLQFLQYKIFGRHRVPDGWIVVTAGNPPEYNNSVREFDIVTWDRLKRIDIEPDFNAWKKYAYKAGVHASIITYLEIRQGDFYSIESTVEGKSFVTARGWEDLSQMIILYEKNNIQVDVKLISQYVQNAKIAKSFAAYYDLFNKYKSDYQIDSILSGKASKEIKTRAKKAKFDERLSLLGLILDAISSETKTVMNLDVTIKTVMEVLSKFKKSVLNEKENPMQTLQNLIEKQKSILENGRDAQTLSLNDQQIQHRAIAVLENLLPSIKDLDGKKAFANVKADFDSRVKKLKEESESTKNKMNHALSFAGEVFEKGQEILVLVTEMTANANIVRFISKYGCDEYFKYNQELMFSDRAKAIEKQIDELKIV